MPPSFSREELERYDRQLRIEGFGLEAQGKLKEARVAVVGLGALGCLSALSLALAGVGELILIDRDRVELSNLNRQVLYRQADVGKPKAPLAAERLRSANPYVRTRGLEVELDEHNALELLEGADVVVDGLDNWRTRLAVNDACVELGIPFVHAGVRSFYGQIMTIVPGQGPCLRCVIRATPPEEENIPVLSATSMTLASLEALEAIKLITGLGEPLVGRLLVFDGLRMRVEVLTVARNPRCPACGRLG